MVGEWIKCNLADACCSIDYGLTASASNHDVGPRFLRITDIVSGHIDWNAVPHIAADTETTKKYQLHHGDIVLARTGASTGASAYVKDPPEAVFASYLVRIKARPEFDSRFLAYYLKSNDFWEFIYGVLGDKCAQPNASASTMTKAPLRAPREKKDQQAIAHILGTLDDKIELNRRMNRALEEMARAIFKSWFVDFDPVRAKMEGRWRKGESLPGLPADLWDVFPGRLVSSELGEIPEGWEVGVLGDIIEIHDSKRIPLSSRERAKRQGSYRYYGAAGIVDYVDDFLFDGIHVLVGEDGSVVTDVGNPVVQYVWGKFWVNNHAHVLKASSGISDEHLLLLLQQVYVVPFVTGAVQPKLSQTNMTAIPAVRAKPEVNVAFNKLIEPIFAKVRALHDEVSLLAAIRDTLLPKLLSGELQVPDAERIAGRYA